MPVAPDAPRTGFPRSASWSEAERPAVTVVTGMSGAGKSTALHALEDLSFFCVDNLPTPLILATLGVCATAGLSRVGLGVDVRIRSFLDDLGNVLDDIPTQSAYGLRVLFLDASDEALLRRYSETRRPHPLSTVEKHEGGAIAVLDGIALERERLSPLRARAWRIIDTSALSVHDLRRTVVTALGGHGQGTEALRMTTRFVSFGFKYGAPVEADLVIDVRFLDNPHFVRELRDLPGTDSRVSDYVLNNPETGELLERVLDLLRFTLPRYEREGKAYLTVAVGCTGGRHRSVAIAQRLADVLAEEGKPAQVHHRDIGKTPSRHSHADLLGGGPRGKGET
jgi:RNase adapter protein RapZ